MMLGLMWRKKSSRRKGLTLPSRRKLQVVVAVAIVLSLFAAWTLLAYSGSLDSVFRHKGKGSGPVSTASFNSNSPSKEYIYAGGRLVATEEPTSLPAPTNFKAIADTVGQIVLSWDAVQGATKYEVQRGATLNG